jgi:hypothetical protein
MKEGMKVGERRRRRRRRRRRVTRHTSAAISVDKFEDVERRSALFIGARRGEGRREDAEIAELRASTAARGGGRERKRRRSAECVRRSFPGK